MSGFPFILGLAHGPDAQYDDGDSDGMVAYSYLTSDCI